MKRLHTGVIILDVFDIVGISFSVGSMLAYGYQRYKARKIVKMKGQDPIIGELKKIDPIIGELKKKSPLQWITHNGIPFSAKVTLIQGGHEKTRLFSLILKNKKLAKGFIGLMQARKNQRLLLLLQTYFFLINNLLTRSMGLRIAASGSFSYIQIILIAFPSTIGGFLIGAMSKHPLAVAFLPIGLLAGRGIEDVPDPYENCRMYCKAAEEFYNKQLLLEMEKLGSFGKDASDAIPLPLLCTENKLSLLERFKLREQIRTDKGRKRVKYFSEFIKELPECAPNPEEILEEILKTDPKIPVKNG